MEVAYKEIDDCKILLKYTSPNNGKGKTGDHVAQLDSLYGMKSSSYIHREYFMLGSYGMVNKDQINDCLDMRLD
jgi:hypothetical protein